IDISKLYGFHYESHFRGPRLFSTRKAHRYVLPGLVRRSGVCIDIGKIEADGEIHSYSTPIGTAKGVTIPLRVASWSERADPATHLICCPWSIETRCAYDLKLNPGGWLECPG